MIEVFMFNKKWRLKITNETFEFKDEKEMKECFEKIVGIKSKHMPYK